MAPTDSRTATRSKAGEALVTAADFSTLPARDRMPIGKLIGSTFLVVIAVWVVYIIATNPNLELEVVSEFFFSTTILHGIMNTIGLTISCMAFAVTLGTILALMRMSTNRVFVGVAWVFVWVVRTVPPLVQIIFWYNLGFLFENLTIRVPFGPILYTKPTNEVMGVYVSAGLGIALLFSGYMSEIIRGGILAVPNGQSLAGMSIGLGRWKRLFRIILPQAMRSILPSSGNQIINLMKTTSLVSVIGLPDLLYSAQEIYARNFKTIPLLVVASLWYLVISSSLMLAQHFLEKQIHKSDRAVRKGASVPFKQRDSSSAASGAVVPSRPPVAAAGKESDGEYLGVDTELRVTAQVRNETQTMRDGTDRANSAYLDVSGLVKEYGNLRAVGGVDLQLARGETMCIIGASGSGKSTLLRCVGLLERSTDGCIVLDGRPMGFENLGGYRTGLPERALARQRRDYGVVFQNFSLFNHMTALDNVSAGPRLTLGQSRAEASDRAYELLERVGLGRFYDLYPNQLSGGQQQRVGIARCLAMQPKLMLFDEPTSALDPELVGEVLEIMKDLASDGMTMLVVTHEMGFARNVANKVAFMKDGIVKEIGSPEAVFENPSDLSLKTFLGSIL